jgi:hypothetical protein
MTCGLGIRKIPKTQIILILMNDQSPTQEVFRLDARDQVTVLTGVGSYLFNIPQIPSMTRPFSAWLRSMILRRPHVKMFTGPLTSFPA